MRLERYNSQHNTSAIFSDVIIFAEMTHLDWKRLLDVLYDSRFLQLLYDSMGERSSLTVPLFTITRLGYPIHCRWSPLQIPIDADNEAGLAQERDSLVDYQAIIDAVINPAGSLMAPFTEGELLELIITLWLYTRCNSTI